MISVLYPHYLSISGMDIAQDCKISSNLIIYHCFLYFLANFSEYFWRGTGMNSFDFLGIFLSRIQKEDDILITHNLFKKSIYVSCSVNCFHSASAREIPLKNSQGRI